MPLDLSSLPDRPEQDGDIKAQEALGARVAERTENLSRDIGVLTRVLTLALQIVFTRLHGREAGEYMELVRAYLAVFREFHCFQGFASLVGI